MHKGLACTLSAVLLTLVLGCSTLSPSQPETGTYESESTNSSQQTGSLAYSFEDIGVPTEMKLQSDESFIMQTPQVKAGTLVYTGWVDADSLSSYYMRSLPRDGWTPLSYFTYDHYLLVFQKPEKVSVIRINKGHLTTRLEIWVSPDVSAAETEFSERVLTQ